VRLELGWQAYEPEPEEDYSGILWMQWSSVGDMRGEMLEFYPGLAIAGSAYVNAATDLSGGGDPYFFPANIGGDPPLYRVLHDVGENAKDILDRGLVTVTTSLSEFFDSAMVRG